MDADDLVVVRPECHQPLDVAALQGVVELELDVVGRSGDVGWRLRTAHRLLRLTFRADCRNRTHI
jgi:hypothetical protein